MLKTKELQLIDSFSVLDWVNLQLNKESSSIAQNSSELKVLLVNSKVDLNSEHKSNNLKEVIFRSQKFNFVSAQLTRVVSGVNSLWGMPPDKYNLIIGRMLFDDILEDRNLKKSSELSQRIVSSFAVDYPGFEFNSFSTAEIEYVECWRKLSMGGLMAFFFSTENDFVFQKDFLKFLISARGGQINHIFQIDNPEREYESGEQPRNQVVFLTRKTASVTQVPEKFIYWRENQKSFSNVSYYRELESIDSLRSLLDGFKYPLRRASTL